MTTVVNAGAPKQITASANVSPRAATLTSIFCSASTSGTCTVYDDPATGTSTKIVDTFNLTAGQTYVFNFSASTGLYVMIAGTSASITVGVVAS